MNLLERVNIALTEVEEIKETKPVPTPEVLGKITFLQAFLNSMLVRITQETEETSLSSFKDKIYEAVEFLNDYRTPKVK